MDIGRHGYGEGGCMESGIDDGTMKDDPGKPLPGVTGDEQKHHGASDDSSVNDPTSSMKDMQNRSFIDHILTIACEIVVADISSQSESEAIAPVLSAAFASRNDTEIPGDRITKVTREPGNETHQEA